MPRIVSPVRRYEPQSDDERRVERALQRIDADDRDVWLRVGMALKSHFGDTGRALWDQWSQQSDKFNPADQTRTWRSLLGSGIGIGTIFYLARAAA